MLDSSTLEDFLKALDNVHDRLRTFDDTLSDSDGNASPYSSNRTGRDNFGFSLDAVSSSAQPEKQRGVRQRKVGIFNPEFKFFAPNIGGHSMKRGKDIGDGDGNDISFL